MRSLLTVSEPLTKVIGSTVSSNSATIDRIGRGNFKSPSAHRINLLPSNLLIHCGTSSVKISAVIRPGICLSTNTKSPLSVARTSKASISTPCFLAKPSAAFVGLPSLKAELAGGPFTSSSLSNCLTGSPLIRTAKRLGVAYTLIESFVKDCSAKVAGMSPCHCWALPATKDAGNSSVPSSNKKLGI
jgi:hypothetical protein